MADGTIVIDTSIDKKKIDSQVSSIRTNVEAGFKNIAKIAGAALATATAAVGAFAVSSVKDFIVFEDKMNEVFTLLPGASTAMKDSMMEDVKALSKEMGVLPEDVIPAVYQALSAGIPKENVFDFVRTSSKLATAGVAKMDDAVGVLSTVVNNYAKKGLTAEEASNMLFTAVKDGVTSVSELATKLGDVVPIAASLGIGFDEVAGATGAMTAIMGKGSTMKAVTNLRGMLNELGKEGTAADEAFQSVADVGFTKFIEKGGTLQEAMGVLKTASEQNNTSINNLFGSIEAGQAALILAGDGAEKFATVLDNMHNSTGATEAAFQTMTESAKFNIDKLRANLDVLKLDFATKFIPSLNKVVETVTTVISKLLGQDSASRNLNTQLSSLITTNNRYKTALDNVKNGVDGVTDATIEQIAIQKQAQLIKLEQTYFDSQKELDKLNRTIDTNREINTRNNKVLDEMANKYRVSRAELASLFAQERLSTDDRDKYRDTVDAINLSYEKYTEAMSRASSAQINQKQFLDSLIQGYVDGSIDISRFIDLDKTLYDQIVAGAVALKVRNKAEEEAIKIYGTLNTQSQKEIDYLVRVYTLKQKNAKTDSDRIMATKMLSLLNEKQNNILAEQAKATEDVSEKEKARAEIVANTTKALVDAEAMELALGDAYDLNAQKSTILTSAIQSLIESGLTPAEARVQGYIKALSLIPSTTTDAVVSTGKATKRIAGLWDTAKDKAFDAIQEQADAYIAMGYSIVDVAKWQSEQIDKYNRDSADKTLTTWGTVLDGMKNQAQNWSGTLNSIVSSLKGAFADTMTGIGEAIATGGLSWDIFAKAGLNALADVLAAIGQQLTAMAVLKAVQLDWSGAAIAGAGATAAFIASGMIKGAAASYDVGGIIDRDQLANIHQGETILPKGITADMKSAGLMIQPLGRNSATSPTMYGIINLDGREIARAVFKHTDSNVGLAYTG